LEEARQLNEFNAIAYAAIRIINIMELESVYGWSSGGIIEFTTFTDARSPTDESTHNSAAMGSASLACASDLQTNDRIADAARKIDFVGRFCLEGIGAVIIRLIRATQRAVIRLPIV
jgi:hypothetical protein